MIWRDEIRTTEGVFHAAHDGDRAVLWRIIDGETKVLARGRVSAMTELADGTGEAEHQKRLRRWLRMTIS